MQRTEILIVDDNAIQAATRSAILSRAGHSVRIAQQGCDALELFKAADFRQSLRLVVTDHLMPGMNGPELVRRVRNILPELPVLVLSGLAEAESEYVQLDVSFRLKPFPPDQLIRIANQLISGTAEPSLEAEHGRCG